MAEYFAQRSGKGNLGKAKTADHCAKMSGSKKGKEHSPKTRAKIEISKLERLH